MVHSRPTEASEKVEGLPCRRRESDVGVRVVSSRSSRQAAARGVASAASMLPEIGARWCLANWSDLPLHGNVDAWGWTLVPGGDRRDVAASRPRLRDLGMNARKRSRRQVSGTRDLQTAGDVQSRREPAGHKERWLTGRLTLYRYA